MRSWSWPMRSWNLRICLDCHNLITIVSKILNRDNREGSDPFSPIWRWCLLLQRLLVDMRVSSWLHCWVALSLCTHWLKRNCLRCVWTDANQVLMHQSMSQISRQSTNTKILSTYVFCIPVSLEQDRVKTTFGHNFWFTWF